MQVVSGSGVDMVDSTPYGIIYLVTETVTGKQYVGQTTGSLHVRWRSHKYEAFVRKADWALCRALRLYGVASFSVEVLDTANSKAELDDKEISHINKLNTMVPSGYNIRSGGHKASVSDTHRQAASQTALNRIYTDEIRRNMSLAQVGKIVSEKSKQKMRASKRKYSYLDKLWTLPELIETGHCISGIGLCTLSARINKLGWNIERALKTPSMRG